MVNDSSLEILQLFQLIELQYLIHHDAFLIKKKQNKTKQTKQKSYRFENVQKRNDSIQSLKYHRDAGE